MGEWELLDAAAACAGTTEDARTGVTVVLSARGDGRCIVACAAAGLEELPPGVAGLDEPPAAVASLDEPPAVAAEATAVTGSCPPAEFVPKAAQPAVNVTAASAAAVTNALAGQARHLPLPRLPRPAYPSNLTRVLPAT